MVLAIFIHALVFLAFWLTNIPYQTTLNNFLISATGQRANFLATFLVFAGLVALWSAAHLRSPWCTGQGRSPWRTDQGRSPWCTGQGRSPWRTDQGALRRAGSVRLYLAVGVFFLIFFYGSFAVLFVVNPVQLYRLGQLYQYFRLFVDAGILLFLAWNLRRWVRADGVIKKAIGPAGLLILWLIPVFSPPGNIYRGALPEKPRLMAHRGASILAPENTLASMQAASRLGIYGIETDISVSADGVPFLMHDATLARTTDVAQLFPERRLDPAENFTWDELSHLNASTWFDGRAVSSRESIPTLEAVLQVIEENGLYLSFDLRSPSAGHPYRDRALALCLEEIKAAGIADHTWVLAEPDAIAQIQSVLPNAILAAGIGYTDIPPSPESLVAEGYRVVNSVYGLSEREIHAYQNAGLWVNLWLVDEPWQYSRLWLMGADSVTSSDIQGFLAMPRPVLALPYNAYLRIWGLLGTVAAGVYWWRVRGGHSPDTWHGNGHFTWHGRCGCRNLWRQWFRT